MTGSFPISDSLEPREWTATELPSERGNEVWLVDLGGEGRRVVKKHRGPLAVLRVQRSYALASGVLRPRLLGASVRDRVVVESWVEGETLVAPPDREASRALAHELLAVAAPLHRIRVVDDDPLPLYAALMRRLDAARGSLRGVGGEELEKGLDEVAERLNRLPQGSGRRWIHGDLRPANAIRTPDGTVALVDWEDARVDHPALDFARLTQELLGVWHTPTSDPSSATAWMRAVWEGWELPDRPTWRATCAVAGLHAAQTLAWCLADDRDPPRAARARAWLERPPWGEP